jgi:hypothetical protein
MEETKNKDMEETKNKDMEETKNKDEVMDKIINDITNTNNQEISKQTKGIKPKPIKPILFNHKTIDSKFNFIMKYIENNVQKNTLNERFVNDIYWLIKNHEGSMYKEPKYGDNYHIQAKVFNPFYQEEIEVDKKLTKLLTGIWSHGIGTTNSCEGNVPRGYVWICFSSMTDFEMFANKIGEYLINNKKEDYDFIDRVLGTNLSKDDVWDYKINLNIFNPNDYDSNDDSNDESDNQTENDVFDSGVSVRFPFKDLKWVENIFLEKIK